LVGVTLITAFSLQSIAVLAKDEGKNNHGENSQQNKNNQRRESKQQDRQTRADKGPENRNNMPSTQDMNRENRHAQKYNSQLEDKRDRKTAERANDRDNAKARHEFEKSQVRDRAENDLDRSRAENARTQREVEKAQARNRADIDRESERNRIDFDRERNHANNDRNRNRSDNDRDRNRGNDARTQNWTGNRQTRPDNRWDSRLDNRKRYQVYRKYNKNWNEQRSYLRTNLRNFNQLAQMNQIQQQQLDNQMRAAYLSYHNNSWNGPYNWDNYSDPNFLDYLQNHNSSLLQTILSALGLGNNDDYLYSSNWDSERSQLAQNLANIHKLALDGRITNSQERELMNQMKAEFMAYHNNQWNGSVSWSQYSDPGFVDYLNTRRPSILTTVRDYLVR
ncbi:MAG: hypothetical protein K2Z81_09060, partial [Cyanobacteria bacterium]|nr:hypothetical protein [Cyanobacteriota bacterium]